MWCCCRAVVRDSGSGCFAPGFGRQDPGFVKSETLTTFGVLHAVAEERFQGPCGGSLALAHAPNGRKASLHRIPNPESRTPGSAGATP